jgi:serine/threonine-protein kinase
VSTGNELLVGGRYRIGEKIGEGGMGAVYRTIDVKTGRAVALKLLLEADEKSLARFRREARAAAALRHPHIVALLDFDIDDPNGAYLVMELVEGISLQALLQREGRLAPARAVSIGRQLFSALAHAHAAGILHRDVKPGNILVSTTEAAPDFVRLVDFGLAKSDSTGVLSAVTTAPAMLGTPAFMPPEQMRGETLDARADVYAAGLVLYRMLSGVDAYAAAGAERVRLVMDRHPGRPLGSLAPWIDPPLAALVDACAAPELTQRPASAAQVIEALTRSAAPAGARSTLVFVVAVTSAVAIGALALAAYALFGGRDVRPPPSPTTAAAPSATAPVASPAPSSLASAPSSPSAAPHAAAGRPASAVCVCRDLRGPQRLCLAPQIPVCTCSGGAVCRESWTTGPTRKCPPGLGTFGGPGKKSGDPCSGLAASVTRDGVQTSSPSAGTLECTRCGEPSKYAGVSGAPCKGVDNNGDLGDGLLECK